MPAGDARPVGHDQRVHRWRRPRPRPSTSGPDAPPLVLECPGETQCPCFRGCTETQTCGPTDACTQPCRGDTDCVSGVSGEACIAGVCGVPCDPNVADGGGCVESGMIGGDCVTIAPAEHYCGYMR